MAAVRVKVTRPLMYLGERRERDEVLRVEPADAWMLCSSGRAELAHAEDIAAVNEAIERENARVVGRIGGRAPDPWIPIGGR